MADYYISNSTGNDANPGTQTQPFQNFRGKLDGLNALNAGDNVYALAGDRWTGLNANWTPRSNGTSSHPITIQKYGAGADPILNGSTLTTGWTLWSGSIWRKTGLYASTQTVGVDEIYSLGKWTVSNTTLAAGTFKNESGTIYIRLADSSDPNGHSIYVPTYNPDSRTGLMGGYPSSSTGQYLVWNHIQSFYSNTVGASACATHNQFQYCTAMGSGLDGMLAYYSIVGGQSGDNLTIDNCTVTYGASNGSGYGQGITSYAPSTTVSNCQVHHNFMAGIDMLYADSDKLVNNFVIKFNNVYLNAQWNDGGSFDPEIYIDGANTGTIFGNVVHSGGGPSGHAVSGITVTAENAGVISHDISIVNNIIYDTSYFPLELAFTKFQAGNLGYNIFVYNNTIGLQDPSNFVSCITIQGTAATGSGVVVKNNIFYKSGSTAIIGQGSDTQYGTNAANVHFDYNCYYNTVNTNVINYGGVNKTLAQWQGTPWFQDTHSIFSDPLFVNSTITSLDAHLQLSPVNSPARNVQTSPWGGTPVLQGTTRIDNIYDTTLTDLGFHYLSDTPNPVVPPPVNSAGSTIRISMTGVMIR